MAISTYLLRRVYLENKIKYRVPEYIYAKKKQNEKELCEKQIEFSRQLGQLIYDGCHIIYVDETTFHKWQGKVKCWVKENMKIAMPNSRGSSYSLLGAMSSQKGLIHFKVLSCSNNQNTFYDFLLALKHKVIGTVYIVMDNLSVHKSKKVQ